MSLIVPYITQIRTGELRGLPPLEIAVEPEEGRGFRHLVLTGPNGTGKTSLLSAIAGEVYLNLRGERTDGSGRNWDHFVRATTNLATVKRAGFDGLLWEYVILTWDVSLEELEAQFKSGHMIGCYLPARRGIEVQGVQTISTEESRVWDPVDTAAPQFLQFLVNRKAQQSFARDDGDQTTVERLETWFHDLERGLARLLGEDDLRLEFDRKSLRFHIVTANRSYNLLELAHGHAAALGILAEILMRVELSHEDADRSHDSGIVLIDEPEVHLHLELQERILPALVAMFPHVQFIVATHSPVVVSSINDAIVFDLEDRKPRRSEDLRGRPYGWIMKRHFGLEEDFDLATTELLHELDALRRLESPTSEQQARLEELAEQLSGTSHALALEVWNRVLVSRLERQEAQGKAAK